MKDVSYWKYATENFPEKSNKGFKHVLTERFRQDVLEDYFGYKNQFILDH